MQCPAFQHLKHAPTSSRLTANPTAAGRGPTRGTSAAIPRLTLLLPVPWACRVTDAPLPPTAVCTVPFISPYDSPRATAPLAASAVMSSTSTSKRFHALLTTTGCLGPHITPGCHPQDPGHHPSPTATPSLACPGPPHISTAYSHLSTQQPNPHLKWPPDSST